MIHSLKCMRFTALASLLAINLPCIAQEEVRITSSGINSENQEFNFDVSSPPGELVVEGSCDLETWFPVLPMGADGNPIGLSDSTENEICFYRIRAFLDTGGQHLDGLLAQQLRADIPFNDLKVVLGLSAATAPGTPITVVRDLPTASRDQRAYAAAIAILSILGQQLLDSMDPQPSLADIAAALATDLASGVLNGLDSLGQAIEIGSSGVFLPEYTDQDLTAVIDDLDNQLSGLRNVEHIVTAGVLTTTIPAAWTLFYWDSAEWQ